MVLFGLCLARPSVPAASTLLLSVFFALSALGTTQDSTQNSTSRCGETVASGARNNNCDKPSASLRVETDLVLVPVSVTDARNRPVVGLHKDNFVLLDQARQQSIRFLSTEDAPLTVGLILDVSNSMTDKIDAEKEALVEFFKQANPDDDYFAVAVSSKPKLLVGSDTIGDIQGRLTLVKPSGYTALLDAIHLALGRMREARYQRKAILIISDGGDNVSRHKAREMRSLAQESDVLIYAVRPFDALPMFKTIEEKLGGGLLSDITQATGGRTISVAAPNEIPEAAAAVSRELRTQYVIGYRPPVAQFDGKWHKIKVSMAQQKNPESLRNYSTPLQVHYRKGYTASRD